MKFVKISRVNLQCLCLLFTNLEYAPSRILKTPNIVKFLNDYKLNSTTKMILIEFKFPVSGISLVGKFNFGL